MIAESPVHTEGHTALLIPASLASVRADMEAIFGPPPIAKMTTGSKAALPFRAPGDKSPITQHHSKATPLLTGTAAGLLIGILAVGGYQMFGTRDPAPLGMVAAPTVGVAVPPFEAEDDAISAPPEKTAPVVAVARPQQTGPMPAGKNVSVKAATSSDAGGARALTASSTRNTAQCEEDRLERAWCMRSDILDADRRLRRAYSEAIRQGVERRFLIEHQRRWARLRKLAARDPDRVLKGYDSLASALERLSVNGRAANRI